jgi:L-ascorbate metabolism protein UlaG (beta-lactamase superfamily)
MKITKLGHCCMVIEEGRIRFLFDPGDYSTLQNEVTNIDYVLITHEHGDHFHIPSLKRVLTNNPEVRVITNSAVGALLDKEGISYSTLDSGEMDCGGVKVRAFGQSHREMYPGMPNVRNVGYFVGERFFFPGDAFTPVGEEVGVLALPIAGPWMKMAESIDYAMALKPEVCFPVHDGNFIETPTSVKKIPPTLLTPAGVRYEILELGKAYDF